MSPAANRRISKWGNLAFAVGTAAAIAIMRALVEVPAVVEAVLWLTVVRLAGQGSVDLVKWRAFERTARVDALTGRSRVYQLGPGEDER